LATGFPKSSNPKDMLDDTFPIATLQSLDRPGVRLYVHDGWSGLAIYFDCGPIPSVAQGCQHARVFIDLRWDFYGAKLSHQYGATHDALPEWRKDLDSSCTTHVLVPPRASIAQVLALDTTEWKLMHQDKLSVLFERARPLAGCPT
jgi:hypothetical protein